MTGCPLDRKQLDLALLDPAGVRSTKSCLADFELPDLAQPRSFNVLLDILPLTACHSTFAAEPPSTCTAPACR